MNLKELHQLIEELIANGHGNEDVAVNLDTFCEGENGEHIIEVEEAEIRPVYCKDPDEKEGTMEPYFVLLGGDIPF